MLSFITDQIAIGSGQDAGDLEALSAAGIRSILCLNGLLNGRTPEACGVERLRVFDLKDGPGNDPGLFELAVHAVGTFVREAPKVLVHCHAGRSRSVVVVAGYLMRTTGCTMAEAMALISKHREIALTPGITGLLEGMRM